MGELVSRLVGPVNIGNGTSTIFTVTTNHTYWIRSIRIVNNTSAAVAVKLGIGGVTDALLILPPISIAPGAAYHDDGFFVLTTGETFQANASATGTTITVSGIDNS